MFIDLFSLWLNYNVRLSFHNSYSFHNIKYKNCKIHIKVKRRTTHDPKGPPSVFWLKSIAIPHGFTLGLIVPFPSEFCN